MSEGFFSRWSRRKAEAQRMETPVPASDRKAADQNPPEETELEQGPAEPVENLPPLDTLGTESDYTVFLRAGVSRAIQTRALAIAWASDPRIADFRGMADYDWDFNAVGYGRLGALDDVADLVRRIVAPSREPETLPPQSAPPDSSTPTQSPGPAVADAGNEEHPAASGTEEATNPELRELDPPAGPREQRAAAEVPAPNTPPESGRSLPRHGGALPS